MQMASRRKRDFEIKPFPSATAPEGLKWENIRLEKNTSPDRVDIELAFSSAGRLDALLIRRRDRGRGRETGWKRKNRRALIKGGLKSAGLAS